jgi:hypothetical protein
MKRKYSTRYRKDYLERNLSDKKSRYSDFRYHLMSLNKNGKKEKQKTGPKGYFDSFVMGCA